MLWQAGSRFENVVKTSMFSGPKNFLRFGTEHARLAGPLKSRPLPPFHFLTISNNEIFFRPKSVAEAIANDGSADDPVDGNFADGGDGAGRKD